MRKTTSIIFKTVVVVMSMLYSVLSHAQAYAEADQSAAAMEVAIVTDLLLPAGNLPNEGPEILDKLQLNQRVSLGANSMIKLVYFSTGTEFRLTGPSRFIVGSEQPQVEQGKSAEATNLASLTRAKLETPVRDLDQAAIIFRNFQATDKQIDLIEPVNTKLLTRSPQFSWRPLADASYVFTLNNSYDKMLFTTTTAQSQLLLPDDVQLDYLQHYQWQVETRGLASPHRGVAKFQIGDKSQIAEMLENQPKDNAEFSQKVVYALLLEQNGFNSAATKLWQQLLRFRPESKTLRERVKSGK